MPYNLTTYPNILQHQSENEAEKALLRYLPLISSNCAPELQPFLCSIHAPQCLKDGQVVLPCKSLCERVTNACQSSMATLQFEWPAQLSCEDLPTEGNCFSIEIEGL